MKEDNKEMQQKAFLCSTLMKSYAFVIMLLPWLSGVTRSVPFVEKFMGKRCIKSEFFCSRRLASTRSAKRKVKTARNAIN